MSRFQNPEAIDRSFLFWAWNGKLDENELCRQVREMKQAGAGGFFIHSRDGLETEYMGKEWMSCVKRVVKEAKKEGLFVWLYDEDRWPSGTAGGRVTRNKKFGCKGLTLEIADIHDYQKICKEKRCKEYDPIDAATGLMVIYAAIIEGSEIKQFRKIDLDGKEKLKKEESLLIIRLETSDTSEWFNGEAPPDNLNPECVQQFIKETHEKYKETVGEYFGNTILGIFTDEPSLNDRHAYFGEKKSWIPWTFGFSEYFRKQNGYDFFQALPYFYFDGKQSRKVRHDYWYTITKRYGEAYFKTIKEWCENNHLLFTGHFLQEDKMGLCARVNGAVMPNYQYQHVPGIDMLCEQTNEYMTVKQCSSVANQLGKKYVLSETYGCTGWEFTFEGQKWIGDWQYVLGVNHRCQHLSLYTLRGCRKRDYPPSFNYNNNTWKDNFIVEEYFARLSLVLQQGKAVRNTLVLHPMSTVWSLLGVDPYGNPRRKEERDVPALNAYGERFNQLIEFIIRHHLDCDLGDEILIEQYGKIEDGRFWIGNASYETVVISKVDTLLSHTWELLAEYTKQGGHVYLLGEFPQMIGGEEKTGEQKNSLDKFETFKQISNWNELETELQPYRTITVYDEYGEEVTDVLYQIRTCGKEWYLVLINNNRERSVKATVSILAKGTVYELGLLTGRIEYVETNTKNEKLQIPVFLEPTGSAAYLISDNEQDVKWIEEQIKKDADGKRGFKNTNVPIQNKAVTKSIETFDYYTSNDNILSLDKCRYRIDDSDFSDVMEVWKAQKEIRKILGMRMIHLNGQEQRYRWIHKEHPNDGHMVELEFVFESNLDKIPVWFILERMDEFQVFLNGHAGSGEHDGWFLDREFTKQYLGKVEKGRNIITVKCYYRNDMELENCYLMGKFGVNDDRKLIPLPSKLVPGDWTKQGFKHFCGSIVYQVEYVVNKEHERIIMKLPEMQGVCVNVMVNGENWKLPWNFEKILDITDLIKRGINKIEIEVEGSPRNMMGPFHLKERPFNTHDESFCSEDQTYADSYLLVPYGMMGPLLLYEEDRK